MSIVFQLTMDCHCEKKSNFSNVFFREHFYKQRPSPLQNTLIRKKRVEEIRKGIQDIFPARGDRVIGMPTSVWHQTRNDRSELLACLAIKARGNFYS